MGKILSNNHERSIHTSASLNMAKRFKKDKKGENRDVEWKLTNQRKYLLPVHYILILKKDYDKFQNKISSLTEQIEHLQQSTSKHIEKEIKYNQDILNNQQLLEQHQQFLQEQKLHR